MHNPMCMIVGTTCSFAIFALAGFIVTLWIGLILIVPQSIWDNHNVAGSICLVLLSSFVGTFCGYIGGSFCRDICFIADENEILIV